MERYICVHGHFYQPPRENATLEAVELQDSAYPYHDWNDRITAECYGPNAESRILDGEGRIARIVNNYSRMSFNFGPTLLAWLAEQAPGVYESILAADRESVATFSGHGSAVAQVYNHLIMPLASGRDKRTQVIWGIRDFQHRFGRLPEGMWLPETAVDLETLDILAEQGIRYTILAQHQASRVRKLGARAWRDVGGGRIDPTRAYELHLPSGRTISLFFYDGAISRAVAFENVLERGEYLAERLAGAFSDSRAWPQIVHIATDGETYGHHRRHGDMALAYALHHIESTGLARLTNYGEYLEKHPPTHEVEIFECTSWSCAHGVERWRSDCGCRSGGHPDWSQEWRGPLREAFDWLRDELAERFERRGRRLFRDPWAARDDYISVILDRSAESVDEFLAQHALRDLRDGEKTRALKLLEIQRHAMLMYTSCGWFFDELSGLETVQVIQYAGRALQLADEAYGDSLEPEFLARLERAKCNLPEHGDGRQIYEKWVKPSLIGLEQVSAHYAVSSLFESYGDLTRVYCYTVDREDYRPLAAGKVRFVLGRANVTSDITLESRRFDFAVLHLGDHNLSAGVGESQDDAAYEALAALTSEAFARADLTELVRVIDRSFRTTSNWLKLLFRDEQRKILGTILDLTLGDTEAVYRQVYDNHAPMMRFLSDLSAPLPKAWHASAELTINADLRRALESEDVDPARIAPLLEEARRWQAMLDAEGLAFVARQTLERMMEQLRETPWDLALLRKLEQVVDVARALPFEVDLWKCQNIYYPMMQAVPEMVASQLGTPNGASRASLPAAELLAPASVGAGSGASTGGRLALDPDGPAQPVRPGAANGEARPTPDSQQSAVSVREWVDHFAALGEKLGVRVEEMRQKVIGIAPAVVEMIETVRSERHVPSATYRLQLNGSFTFADARAITPYLQELGVSDCYASPLLKARSNSSHGYDISDHSQISPVLGGWEGYRAFSDEAKARGLGIILDVVPNHMGIGDASNVWWMDVLENGPSSIYASYFDIDWHRVKPELRDKVLLPILEDQYGKVLEGGKLRLVYDDAGFFIYHYETKLPVAPRSYSNILRYQLDTLVQALGEDHEDVRELQSILTALSYLPDQTERSPEKVAERNREKEIIKGRVAALYRNSAYVRAAIDTAVKAFNGRVGDPRSFDLLHELLSQQAYRPAYWRVAAEEINYRRFFEINDLVAIRAELPEVFAATHQVVLQLLAEGRASGLRIDHPDGLWNPRSYFRQLQASAAASQIQARLGPEYSPVEIERTVAEWFANQDGRNGAARSGRGAPPLYVVAEKILSPGESLPLDWAVDGTTGYDFLNLVNGLFVDGSHRRAFDAIYSRFIGSEISFHNLANSTKKMIMLVSLASEVNTLAHHLERVSEKNRLYRDFTLNTLTFAIREIIAALPVYRTYISGPGTVGPEDEAHIEAAVAEAKRRNPRTAASIFDFIRDSLLLRNLEDFAEEDRQPLTALVMKFQQITGPVMAKGVEDTAFYVYNRLVSLNEVGGHPEQFGVPVPAFHRHNAERLRLWPHSLLTTSTHDTKRSEDVRARIDVLSELPDEWRAALARWGRLNAPKKARTGDGPAPDRNDEYLLYQTLLGAWPDGPIGGAEYEAFRQRIAAYMHKATKEAKTHTSWINANEEYDRAVQDFVAKLLVDDPDDPFLKDFLALQRRVAYFGRLNSLSQALLKLTAPGVPDIYQGSELWDLSLVDPDNRRPVDFRRRAALLAELKGRLRRDGDNLVPLAEELLETAPDGRVKLYLMHRALDYRRAHFQLFAEGAYHPLAARGARRDHVVSFARAQGAEAVVVVAPRLVVGLAGGQERPPIGPGVWGDTWLALPREVGGQRYRNVLTGEVLAVGERDGVVGLPLDAVLAHFPVALLERLPI